MAANAGDRSHSDDDDDDDEWIRELIDYNREPRLHARLDRAQQLSHVLQFKRQRCCSESQFLRSSLHI